MSMNKGLLFIIFVGCSFIFIIYATNRAGNLINHEPQNEHHMPNPISASLVESKLLVYHRQTNSSEYNIFIIYTKEDVALKDKLNLFLKSLLKFSTVPLHLHFFCDSASETSIEEVLKKHTKHNDVKFTLYDLKDTALKINDYIINVMPLFTYSSGSYYNDALFLLSLGLHRVLDTKLKRGILIDVDVVLRTDIKELFQQFNNFSPDHLFGLAPELTPVYRHILYRYRSKNPKSLFGSPYYLIKKSKSKKKHHKIEYSSTRHGYPGLNSGVILMNLDRIRKSRLYEECLSKESIKRFIEKYSFRGHLGDQDFYSILGYELPDLIYHLDCVWNRQLCTWWKENGYSEVFENYFYCEGAIKIYHGNCNTRIPQ